MKKDRSNVVKVAIECEKTSSGLVGPYFDLVVVSTGDEQRLCLVEVNAAYWTIMLLESVNQSAHTIVPQSARNGQFGTRSQSHGMRY